MDQQPPPPPKSGVYTILTPRTIMTGTALEYQTHFRIPLGEYELTHEDTNLSNTLIYSTQGYI